MSRERSRARVLWLHPLRAAGIGAAAGAVVVGVALVVAWFVPREPGSFADLGVVVGGLVLGVVVALAVWFVGLARVATRLFERSRRLDVLTAAVGAVFVLAVAFGLAGGRLEGADLPGWVGLTLGCLAGLVLLATPSAVFAALDRRAARTSSPTADAEG